MLLITDLNDIPSLSQPCGLTIGNFDGVHVGHQTLLKHLKSKLPSDGILVVFTFINHPSHLFTPEHPTPLICPPLQKVKHLTQYGAGMIILIPFTPKFANISFKKFIKLLNKQIKFSSLVLGQGATFGKNKEGNETNIQKLATELAFEVAYLPKTMRGSAPVSSGRIRSLISQGNFSEVQSCLGRPYSLMGHLHKENGFYQFHLPWLCFPPSGIYPVRVKVESTSYLGRAQILAQEQLLRLDFLNSAVVLEGQNVEVIF